MFFRFSCSVFDPVDPLVQRKLLLTTFTSTRNNLCITFLVSHVLLPYSAFTVRTTTSATGEINSSRYCVLCSGTARQRRAAGPTGSSWNHRECSETVSLGLSCACRTPETAADTHVCSDPASLSSVSSPQGTPGSPGAPGNTGPPGKHGELGPPVSLVCSCNKGQACPYASLSPVVKIKSSLNSVFVSGISCTADPRFQSEGSHTCRSAGFNRKTEDVEEQQCYTNIH